MPVANTNSTWNGSNDDWSTAADWSPVGVPGASNNAIINGGQPTIFANVGTIAGLTVAGSLRFSHGALTVSGDASVTNSLFLDTGGGEGGSSLTVNGTLTNSGAIQIGNGSLSAPDTVSVQNLANTGSFYLEGSSAHKAVLNVNNVAGLGATGVATGSLYLGYFSSNSLVEFASGQINTIASNGRIDINSSTSFVADADDLTHNSALKGLTSVAGFLAIENGATVAPTGDLNVNGVVQVDNTGGGQGGASLAVAGTLTNSGQIDIGNSALSADDFVSAQALNNTGSIYLQGSAAHQALLNVNSVAGFGTTGVVTGSIYLGYFASNSLVEFKSGQINTIAGGARLDINSGSSFVADADDLTHNSALTGLDEVDGIFTIENQVSVAPAADLNVKGRLAVDNTGGGQGGSTLAVKGTITNSGEIDIGNSALSADDLISAQALNNTGSIYLQGSATHQALLNIDSVAGFGTAGVVTGTVSLGYFSSNSLVEFKSGQLNTIASGAHLDINSSTSFVADADDLTHNSALTGLNEIDGTFSIEDQVAVAPSANLNVKGHLQVDNTGGGQGGSTLAVKGTLANSGEIDIGNGALSADDLVSAQAINNTGSIYLEGSASHQGVLNINSAAGFGTAGVVTGTVALGYFSSNTLVEFKSGQINTIASGAHLDINSSTSFVADADDLTHNSALTGLNEIDGTFSIEDQVAVAPSANLNVTGRLQVDATGGGQGGTTLAVKGTLTNSGEIDIGNGSLSADDLVSAQALANSGGIYLGGSGSHQAVLNVNSAAGFGTTGVLTGTVALGYFSSNSLVEFKSGQINTIASGARLDINSSTSFVADADDLTHNSALTGLTENDGFFAIENGVTVAPSGDFKNTGRAQVDNSGGGQGGSTLAVKGTLTNTGEIDIGNGSLSADDLVSAQAISNTGSIYLEGSASHQAVLNINSAAGFGTAGTLTGTVALGYFSSNSLVEFKSGQINTIASGAILDINSNTSFVADADDLTHNSALTGLSENDGNFAIENGATVAPSGNLKNTGRVQVDNTGGGEGGATLAIKGTLTNTGEIDIGNNNLSAADVASAASVVNTGNIYLYSGGSQAKLAATNQIENAGNLNIYFDSTVTAGSFLQDRSGQLTIELQGTDAAHHGTIATTGGVTLNGGTLNTPQFNFTLAAGQTFTLATFAPGQLVGMFSNLGNQADGATYTIGNGLLLGIEYDDSLGTIVEKIVAAPASNADSWTGGTADWSVAANWSNGAPDFYSAVTISTAATAAVTLSHDATIDSLTVGAKDTLSASAGTDLSIGTTINVSGALTIGGEAFVDGAATNNGAITVNGSVLDIRGAVTGSGGFAIGANAELEFGSSDAETVTFNGANATLKLDSASAFTGTLANLAVGDKIDLVGLTVVSPTVTGGTTLNFTDTNNNHYSYTLTGFPGGAGFVAQSDGAGGTLLTVTPPATSVTLNPITGDNVINSAEAHAGVTVGGAITGLAVGATFALNVVDGVTSKSYTATVNTGGATWSASVPASDLLTFADGSASFTAFVNASTQASQSVVIHETLPTLAISTVAGDNTINYAEAHAAGGVAVSGTSTGLASGATVSVKVVDGVFSKTYSATVGANGAWTTTIPSADAITLPNGANAATVTANATDAFGNPANTASRAVSVEELQPTLTLNPVDGNNVINHAQAAAGLTIAGGSSGLANGATFSVTLTDGAFSKAYTATVGAGGVWSASVPAADASGLGNGANALTVSAQASDAFGNATNVASETVTVQGNLPTLAISTVAGDNVINRAEAAAGVTISGTSTGLANGATFSVTLTDGAFSKAYTATVGAGGVWSATVPASDASGLVDGSASLSAQATDAFGNPSNTATAAISVHETLPTLAISTVAGDNTINSAEAHAAGGVAVSGTSTGLASGATVSVKVVDGVFSKTYSATVGAGGAWTATIPSADAITLPNGVNAATVTANATDAFGNPSNTASQAVSVQDLLPTLAISTVAGDNVINRAEAAAGVTISGTSTGLASGATFTVTLTDGGFSKGYTATVGAGGAWSATISASDASGLVDGSASLSAQATDAFGNPSNTATAAISVHETLPTLAISTIAGDNTINYTEAHAAGGVAVSGTSTGLASGATVSVKVVDGVFSKTYSATVGANGAWTTTIPSADAITLPNGANAATVTATATDAYGNPTNTASQAVSVEDLLPTLAISTVAGDNVINRAEAAAGVTISGTSTGLANGATFNVTLTDGAFSKAYTATVGAGGAWTATVPASDASGLVDGAASLSAQANDAFGNPSNVATAAISVHETLPTLAISTVAGDNTVNYAEAHAAGGVAVSGTSTGLASGATVSVKVVDGVFSKTYSATVGANGAWTTTIPSADAITLPNGANAATVTANATDAFGNPANAASRTVSVEELQPTLTLDPVDGNNVINHAQAAAGLTITGGSSGLANGATFSVTLTDGAFSKAYTATVGAGGVWSASVPAADASGLGNGANALTVSAQASDAFGNATNVASETVTVQGNLPTLTISTVAGDNVINRAEAAAGVTISGTSTGLANGATFSVTLTDGAFSKAYTATVGAGGVWSATVPASDASGLVDGSASLSAQATDAFGNPSNTATAAISVHETLPTLAISTVAGDNVIDRAEAAAGVTISGTSTGLANGATFSIMLTDGAFSKAYTATVGAGGVWSATVPASDASGLVDGSASLSAKATDAFGNPSNTATAAISVHETLPTLAISTVAGDNVINRAEAAAGVTISGTSTGLASGATFNVTLTDGAFSKAYTATVGAGGAWTATVPASDASGLVDGSASLSAKATDAFGNPSNTATAAISVHETLPTLTISTVAGDNVINRAEAAAGVTISGISTGLANGATFSVALTDGAFSKAYTATVGAGGAWTATVPASDASGLVDGSASLSAQATDAFGNPSNTATAAISVHETLPTLAISTVAGDNVINRAEAAAGLAISGISTGLANGATFSVTLTDGAFSKAYTATVGAGGAWTATVPASDASGLVDGSASLSAQATDAFGNPSNTATAAISVHETLPTLAISTVAGDNTINLAEAQAGVAVAGTSTGLASGATVSVKVVDGAFSKTYSATVGANGAWTTTIPSADAVTLPNGVNAATVTASATDAFGNPANTASQTVTVAETQAVTLNPVAGDNAINYAEAHAAGGVLVSGTLPGAANGTQFGVSVKDGFFSKTYTATVGANGVWTATIPTGDASALPNGTATVTANAGAGVTASEAVTVAETRPTIAKLAETPATGDLDAGASVTLTLTSSAPVTVTGAPELALNVGELATYDAAKSSPTQLAFDYTVQAGDNTPQLLADYVLLNGGAIADSYGNALLLSLGGFAQKGPQIDTQAPVFIGEQETPATGALGIGKSVVLDLYVDEAVKVTGGPTLTLNDGGTATYLKAQSTATMLAFRYTVLSGQTTPDLEATAVNLAGGSIDDLAGNPIALSLANIDQSGPAIMGLPPKVTAIAEAPATGDFNAGKAVSLTLTMSEAVTVTGAPRLTLNDGGVALYNAAKSTSTQLQFDYTVAAGQNVAALAATALTLNGGKIVDAFGNAANLSLAGLAQSGPQIDTISPKFTAIVETPATGDFAAGKPIKIALTASEAVQVAGAPRLTLNDGGVATYDAAASTATNLVFDYTVAAGQNTAALKASAVSLNGGSILDLGGNAANLSLAGLTQTGPQIDTTAPKFTAVAESPATGDFTLGKLITLTLTTSEAVTVSGAPTLTLNDGGVATYDAANSTATKLVFDYTVGAGQNIAALKASAITLGGGAILDLAGNAANLSLAGLAQAGPKIDTTAPTVTAVTETPATGDYGVGKALTLALTLSEAVAVTGAPNLTLNDGGVATYDAAKSTATKLVFDYTVGAGQNTAALKASAVSLNGGTVDDLAGNAANLSLAGLAQAGPQIDTVAPTLVSIAGSASGDLLTGQTDIVTAKLSEAVKVTGAPTLILDDGGVATYASGSGTNTLTFSYKALAGQSTPDLQIVGVNFPSPKSVADLAGNPLVLPSTAADLNVAVNNVLTLSGSQTYQILGPSNKDVTFAPGASADLILTDSQHYTGHVSGLTPSDILDLRDISFGAGTTQHYAGTTASGVLSVTDGAHTAAISLLGDFTHSAWTLSNDGYNGTQVVDPLAGSLAQARA